MNLSMTLSDYENLLLVSEQKGIENPGTCALSILVQELREYGKKYRDKGILPGQQNMFKGKKKDD